MATPVVVFRNPLNGSRWRASGNNIALLTSWGWLPVDDPDPEFYDPFPGYLTGSELDPAVAAEVADGASATSVALRAAFGTGGEALRRRLLAAVPPPALAFPAPMALLPKFNARADISSLVVNPYLVPATPDNLGPLRWSGPPGLTSATSTVAAYNLFDGTSQTTAIFWASTSGEVAWDFVTDEPNFHILSKNNGGSPWWVTVNGESLTRQTIEAPGNDYMAFEFGSREVRRIRIRSGDGFRLAGVIIGKTSSMTPPVQTRPLVAALGDSYWGGWAPVGAAPRTVKYVVGELLGWDWRSHSVGGTGWVQESPANTGDNSFIQRVGLFDTTPLDAGLFLGGLNDPTTGFQAAVAQVLGQFRDTHPNIPIFVVAPWSPSSTIEASANHQTKRAALAAEAQVVGGHFIDTAGWVTGTGNRGAPNGSGNADTVINPDGTHPFEPDGSQYLGYRLAAAIADILNQKIEVAA